MKTHTLINEIMYICPLCVRKFKDEQELKNHEERSALHKRMYDQLVVWGNWTLIMILCTFI